MNLSQEPIINKFLLPLGNGVNILNFHESGIIAFEKPDTVLSHPNSPKDINKSLLKLPYDLDKEYYLLENEVEGVDKIYLLNRLDSATSGVILGATNLKVAKDIRKAFETKALKKQYYALVKNSPLKSKGTWENYLDKNNQSGQLRVRAHINKSHFSKGKYAKTHFELERKLNQPFKYSLLKLEPVTGRTHQLRVQCALHNLPIIGDKTYGDFQFNRLFAKTYGIKRLMLHAYSIEIDLKEELGIIFSAKSNLPHDFDVE